MQVTIPQCSGSSPKKTMPGKNCFAFLKGQRQRCVFLQTSPYTEIVEKMMIVQYLVVVVENCIFIHLEIQLRLLETAPVCELD